MAPLSAYHLYLCFKEQLAVRKIGFRIVALRQLQFHSFRVLAIHYWIFLPFSFGGRSLFIGESIYSWPQKSFTALKYGSLLSFRCSFFMHCGCKNRLPCLKFFFFPLCDNVFLYNIFNIFFRKIFLKFSRFLKIW